MKMRPQLFTSFLGALMLCLMGQVLFSTATPGVLGFLGPMALRNLFLVIGLVGPIQAGLLALAGIGLGATGSALGGTALGLALFKGRGDKDDDMEIYQMPMSWYGRKRRDLRNQDIYDEEDFKRIQRSDPKKCTEKLVCSLSSKMQHSLTNLPFDERAILSMVKEKPTTQQESDAHLSLEEAYRQGFENNCSEVYSSCEHSAELMMYFLRLLLKSLDGESPRQILELLR